MNRETIEQYLNLLEGWVTYQYTYLKEGLALCDEFKDMMQSCELRPLFYINFIDVFNPKEPTARIKFSFISHNTPFIRQTRRQQPVQPPPSGTAGGSR